MGYTSKQIKRHGQYEENNMSNKINVNIPNVIAWFKESEQCMLHNHAEEIPNSLLQSTKPSETDIHATLMKFARIHAHEQVAFLKELKDDRS